MHDRHALESVTVNDNRSRFLLAASAFARVSTSRSKPSVKVICPIFRSSFRSTTYLEDNCAIVCFCDWIVCFGLFVYPMTMLVVKSKVKRTDETVNLNIFIFPLT